MATQRIACPKCRKPVDQDTVTLTRLLDPDRDPVKSPNRLHICAGKPDPVPVVLTLNARFRAGPAVFLADTVVVVPEATDTFVGTPKVAHFELVAKSANVVALTAVAEGRPDAIKAYYLPWAKDVATSMPPLGAEADYFFTSEMTNCRFAVLVDDATAPVVAHVAGTINSPGLRTVAQTKAFGEVGVDTTAMGRPRSLSVSDSRTKTDFKTKVKTPAKHAYTGQLGDESNRASAFTFGLRTAGSWSFHAQIARGVLTDSYYAVDLTDNVAVLGYVDFANL